MIAEFILGPPQNIKLVMFHYAECTKNRVKC